MKGDLLALLLLVTSLLQLFSGVEAGPPWLQAQPIQNVQLAFVQLYCEAGFPFIVDQGQTQPIFISVCQVLGIQYTSVQQVCLYVTTNPSLVNASYTPSLNPQNAFLLKQSYEMPYSGPDIILQRLLLEETLRPSFQTTVAPGLHGARLSTVEMVRFSVTPWPSGDPFVQLFFTTLYNERWQPVFNQYFAGTISLHDMCLQMAPIWFKIT
jgi:hypothetical protein